MASLAGRDAGKKTREEDGGCQANRVQPSPAETARPCHPQKHKWRKQTADDPEGSANRGGNSRCPADRGVRGFLAVAIEEHESKDQQCDRMDVIAQDRKAAIDDGLASGDQQDDRCHENCPHLDRQIRTPNHPN